MRRVLALGLSMLLCGCGVSPAIIKTDTIAFGEVIEDTTNKLLVVNLLRARDKAPLHFSDIPVIRESMQQSASLGFLDLVGSSLSSTTLRDTRSGTLTFQSSPSFELTHLQSKDFITGISSPIDPKIVKYWLDRGLDRRIVLLLFFSSAEIVETRSENGPVNTIKIMNSPRDAIDVIRGRKYAFSGPEALKCDTQADFERYLKLLNLVRTFFANTFRERRLLAKGMNLDPEKDSKNLQNFAALDQTKVQLVYDKGLSAYSLYALSSEQKVAFCFYDDRASPGLPLSQYGIMQAGGERMSDRRSCYQSVVDAPVEDSTKPRLSETPVFFRGSAEVNQESRFCEIYNRIARVTPRATDAAGYPRQEVRLHIRSVGEIFQFLGDLLQYQDEVRNYLESEPRPKLTLNTPVTFGYCPDDPGSGCNDVFFRLDGDPRNARFTLTYRDREYAVANINSLDGALRRDGSSGPGNGQQKDHTIEILSVLHQLVNLNKSATDIRATPSVQVLP
jgi:hypothetical protein